MNKLKGKTYTEVYGKERAYKIKKKLSDFFIKNPIKNKCTKKFECAICKENIALTHKNAHERFHKNFHKCSNSECNNMIRKSNDYCSRECWYKCRQDNFIESWFLKKNVPQYQLGLYKKYLIKMFGNKCMTCGVTTWEDSPVPLVLDHIDGDNEHNSPENLRILCCNCGGLLNTYTGRNNKGKARKLKSAIYIS
jgi:hypothetical protein